MFNVVDDYNREGLGIEVDLSLPSTRVIRSLDHIIEWLGKPDALRCDNGSEHISQKLIDWANKWHITLMYTHLLKTLTLSVSIEPQDKNGWIYICLNRLNMLKTWRLSSVALDLQ